MPSKTISEKAYKRINILKKAFTDGQELSISQIMEILKVNRTSAYNYLNKLEESGSKLIVTKKNRVSFYKLAAVSSNIENYELLDLNVLRSFIIVRTLQQNPMRHKKLLEALNIRQAGYDELAQQSLDIGRTQFDILVRELLQKGIIVQDKKDKILYPSGHEVPILLQLADDQYWELYDQLEHIAPGYPYYPELRRVYEKLCLIEAEFSDVDSDIYHVYGRKYSQLECIREKYKDLALEKCISHKVKCKIRGRNGNPEQYVYLATGLIVYSADKDELYIIGKEVNHFGRIKTGFRVIRVDSVLEIQSTEFANPYWHAKEFKDIYNIMYSITTESVKEKIVVEFDNVANIKYKLKNLLGQRKDAKLEIKDTKIIYTDFVMGLPDVETYLRQFGKSCRVIEPQKLRDMMKLSVEKSLAAYKEYATEGQNGNKL